MPLQKLQFTPGVNRESTSLANEGTWFECDKIRFRSGYPEKIGGWVLDPGRPNTASGALAPPSGMYWGVARHLWAYLTLNGRNLLAIGTNLKFYLEEGVGGIVYDITPIRETTAAGAVTFAATNGSATITVTDTSHGASPGDFVTFSGAASLGGNITAAVLNKEYQIVSVPTSSTYTITATATANSSDSGNGGASTVGAYQINTRSAVSTATFGWGAGGWSGVTFGEADTGWGESRTTQISVQAALWSSANWSERLIINPRNGALYMQIPSAGIGTYNRAVLLSPSSAIPYQTDSGCPTKCAFVMVSDINKIVIAFGCNDYGSSTQDPMLIRWSSQESDVDPGYTTWTPTGDNQAGSARLSHGSYIKSAIQTRQEILVFTDASVYSMQYIELPLVWSLTILGDNISFIGPNAAALAGNVVYWMGVDKFYVYDGRVQTLPCTLRQYVFSDINLDQAEQCFASTNEGYNEIWWFYCSANSTTVDKYVIYNYLEKTWSYGTMARTAWLDSPLRTTPTAAAYDGKIVYHEVGVDDGSVNPPAAIDAYVQSADFNIGDGHNYGFVWRMIPDLTFDNSNVEAPTAYYTLKPRQNPGSNYNVETESTITSANNYSGQRTYTVQQFTQILYVRVRGRQMAFRVGSDTLGTAWQLGAPAIDIRPDGRRA
jgi:hypothetical protein